MLKRISFVGAILAIAFTAQGQWQPSNATSTDSIAISRLGSVGVGTNAPSTFYRMTVQGTTSGVNTGIYFTNGSSSSYELAEAGNNTTGVQLWNYNNGYIRFGVNNTEAVHISANGN